MTVLSRSRPFILHCHFHSSRCLQSPFRPLSTPHPAIRFIPSHASHFSVTARFRNDAPSTVVPPDYLSEGELAVFEKLKRELGPTKLEVQDISGGCGSMYGLDIVSPKFKGMSVIKQHKLVNSILKDELQNWHGMQLKTKAA